MVDPDNLLAVIARVRRAMPRNPDVMTVCNAAEKLHIDRVADRSAEPQPSEPAKASKPATGPTFDKTAYQREYMRQRRHKTKRTEEKTSAALAHPIP